jgi:CheY-like chemotaxis protein
VQKVQHVGPDVAQQVGPDVIVLDFQMPEMNGLDAARSIQEQSPRNLTDGLGPYVASARRGSSEGWDTWSVRQKQRILRGGSNPNPSR